MGRMTSWRERFTRAFLELVSGPSTYPHAAGELEELIREVVRDEIQKARHA